MKRHHTLALVSVTATLLVWLAAAGLPPVQAAENPPPKKIAAIVSVYYQNSHADVIVSRLLETNTLDFKGRQPNLKLVSLYVDQFPENDKSRALAEKHGFTLYDKVADALTLGTGKLAVDGVLLVAEHGKYPVSPTGQTVYPKRRLFEPVAEVFRASGRSVPVFIDKHLADNWTDAKWIYDQCRELKAPLMAGSTLPILWRYPPVDPPRGEPIEEIVATSYHTLDGYGFHALEMLQAFAERRKGGETGVRAVQCVTGEEVWRWMEDKAFDVRLLDACFSRLKHPHYDGTKLHQRVKEPVLWRIEYADGLKATVLTLNWAVAEWAIAWRGKDQKIHSTLCWTQEARPFMHFGFLVDGIEQMMHTGKPSWPAERTLMTSGILDALLISKTKHQGQRIETPHLMFSYDVPWQWRQPPPPPADRPLNGQ